MNTATAVNSCGQALGLNAVIPTCFYAMFQLRNSECSKNLESERFIMSVTQVVNYGEKFDDCRYVNRWEWISVNGSQTGLVSGFI